MILNSCVTFIELSFINRNIIGGGFLFAMIMKNLLIHNHSLKNERFRNDSAQQLNLVVQYFIILQFLSFLPYFFSIFLFGSD